LQCRPRVCRRHPLESRGSQISILYSLFTIHYCSILTSSLRHPCKNDVLNTV
jgi:hypothetical protein